MSEHPTTPASTIETGELLEGAAMLYDQIARDRAGDVGQVLGADLQMADAKRSAAQLRALAAGRPAVHGNALSLDASPLLERLSKLARTLSQGVKTRNMGRCERCGNGTSSGMDPYCHRCTGIVAAECLDDARALAAAIPSFQRNATPADREAYFSARTKERATDTRTVTGDEWNAVARLRSVVWNDGPLTPDQATFALGCVEDLGEAEWRVRRDRDRLADALAAVQRSAEEAAND